MTSSTAHPDLSACTTKLEGCTSTLAGAQKCCSESEELKQEVSTLQERGSSCSKELEQSKNALDLLSKEKVQESGLLQSSLSMCRSDIEDLEKKVNSGVQELSSYEEKCTNSTKSFADSLDAAKQEADVLKTQMVNNEKVISGLTNELQTAKKSFENESKKFSVCDSELAEKHQHVVMCHESNRVNFKELESCKDELSELSVLADSAYLVGELPITKAVNSTMNGVVRGFKVLDDEYAILDTADVYINKLQDTYTASQKVLTTHKDASMDYAVNELYPKVTTLVAPVLEQAEGYAVLAVDSANVQLQPLYTIVQGWDKQYQISEQYHSAAHLSGTYISHISKQMVDRDISGVVGRYASDIKNGGRRLTAEAVDTVKSSEYAKYAPDALALFILIAAASFLIRPFLSILGLTGYIFNVALFFVSSIFSIFRFCIRSVFAIIRFIFRVALFVILLPFRIVLSPFKMIYKLAVTKKKVEETPKNVKKNTTKSSAYSGKSTGASTTATPPTTSNKAPVTNKNKPSKKK